MDFGGCFDMCMYLCVVILVSHLLIVVVILV